MTTTKRTTRTHTLTRVTAVTAALAAAVLTSLGAGTAAHADGSNGSDSINQQDKTYVSGSSEGDLFEIAAGRLAMHRAHDPAVRRFGHRMVVDHTRLYRATRAVARGVGLDVETQPSRGQQAVLRSWHHLSGRAFVCAYVPYEWEDHQLDISDAQEETEDGQAPAVISDAEQALPVLNKHLDLASKLLHGRHC